MLGAGAALFLGAAPRVALAGGKTDVPVLTCMDYRLVDDVRQFMDSKGTTDRCDRIVLAGASAGVMHPTFAEGRQTYWGHPKVSVDLHAIHKVMVIDHRDFGACKLAFGPDLAADPAHERAVHGEMPSALAAESHRGSPKPEVEGNLMTLDGSVEEIDVGLA